MYCRTSESDKGGAGTIYFSADSEQASAEVGVGGWRKTVQQEWEQLCPDLSRKKIYGICEKSTDCESRLGKGAAGSDLLQRRGTQYCISVDEKFLHGAVDYVRVP